MTKEILTVDRFIEGIFEDEEGSRDFWDMEAEKDFDLISHPRYSEFIEYLFLHRETGRLAHNPISLNLSDFSGVIATGVYFPLCHAVQVDFSGSQFKGSYFEGAHFLNSNFSDADFRESNFNNCVFNGSILEGVKLYGANLENIRCTEAQRKIIDKSIRLNDFQERKIPFGASHLRLHDPLDEVFEGLGPFLGPIKRDIKRRMKDYPDYIGK